MAGKRKRPGRPVVDEITDAQRQTLRAIREFVVRHQYPPTMQELGKALKITAASAHQLIVQLERKGYVARQRKQPRSLKILREPEQQLPSLVSLQVYGKVSAGPLLLSDEDIRGEVLVDSGLVGKSPCFALEVTGDSMIDAGIRDGDIVIVRRQPVVENGEIVIALHDDEHVMKRFYFLGDRIELRPENKRVKTITIAADAEFRIVGKVIATRRQGTR